MTAPAQSASSIDTWLGDAPAVDRSAALELLRSVAHRLGVARGWPGLHDDPGVRHAWLDDAPLGSAGPEVLGRAWEALLAPPERRRRGVHFTPPALAALVVDEALAAWSGHGVPSVWDPAAGGGAFLVAAAEALYARGADRADVSTSMRGTEIEPDTAAVAQLALELWAGRRLPKAVTVGDALLDGAPAGGPFDLVLGNPPFLGQLDRRTARNRSRDAAVREALDLPLVGLADEAALFLDLATASLGPDGVCSLVLPQSLLGAVDATVVRERVAGRCRLASIWVEAERSFDADVDVVVVTVVRSKVDRPRPVVARVGDGATVEVASPDPSSWAPLLAASDGIPGVHLSGPPLSDVASVTAGFRQHFYGIRGAIAEAAESPVQPGRRLRLVTAGVIDPLADRWGTRPITFAKQRWTEPVLDIEAIDDRTVADWFRERARPKLLVASQTRVIEAVVDEHGSMVPSVPVLSVEPGSPDRDLLFRLAAALSSPAASAWLASRAAGTGLSSGAFRVRAATLAQLPLPTDASAWAEGAAIAESAAVAAAAGRVDHYVERMQRLGAVMTTAYRTGDDVRRWWEARGRFRVDEAERHT